MLLIRKTSTSTVYVGTLWECRDKARRDGLVLVKSQGRVLSMDGGITLYATSPITTHFYDNGLIQKGQDDWCLVSNHREK